MIEHLIATMNADMEIDRVREDIEAFAEKFREAEATYELQSAHLIKLRNEQELLVAQNREAEDKLKDDESRLRKSKARLNEIKTNFEYQAMKREVESIERGSHELAESVARKTIELGQIAEKLKAVAESFAKVEEEYQAFKRDLDHKTGEMNSLVESKEKERGDHETKVDRAILSKYRMIRERKFRDALVEVSQGACQGCYMNLPPQMANDILRSSSETVFQCPHCQRLLYKKSA